LREIEGTRGTTNWAQFRRPGHNFGAKVAGASDPSNWAAGSCAGSERRLRMARAHDGCHCSSVSTTTQRHRSGGGAVCRTSGAREQPNPMHANWTKP